MADNEVTTAVVIDPIRREEFSASLGGGSDLNNNKIRASKQNTLEDAMLSFKKSNKNSEFNFEKAYKELANQNLNMRESGCLSLDLSYIGAGRLDGVWGYDVSLIDFASGALIAQEGGALASNFNGDPKFIMENNIISATSKIYKSILKSIKPNFTN